MNCDLPHCNPSSFSRGTMTPQFGEIFPHLDGLLNRREILRSYLGVLGFAAVARPALPARLLRSLAIPGRSAAPQAVDDGMIVYSREYLTLEMPMSLLNSWITPVDSFFVRNNLLMPPAVDPSAWTLSITGEVERPLTINFHDFMQLATSKVINTIECAGNSRVNFRPPIGGVRWGRGAVGNAGFEGPTLAAVLRLAGLKPTAKHVAFRGLDVIPPGASEFIRSIPIEKAMERSTLLATKMNDSPLTPSHGFPVRALVPGWIGSASIKWLQEIRVLSHEFHGFYMDPGYRIPVASSSGSESEPCENSVAHFAAREIHNRSARRWRCTRSVTAPAAGGSRRELGGRIGDCSRGSFNRRWPHVAPSHSRSESLQVRLASVALRLASSRAGILRNSLSRNR